MATDPRPTRSRAALIHAITGVLAEQAPDAINITDIVRAAGVSRPTFYQHFADTTALTRAAALEKLKATFAAVDAQNLTPETEDFTNRFTTALLLELRDDATFCRNVLKTAGDSALMSELIGFLSNRLLNHSPFAAGVRSKITEHESYAEFIAAGMSWSTMRWLCTDFTGDNAPEAMAERLTTMVRAAVY